MSDFALEIPLPPTVEQLILQICKDQSQQPPDSQARHMLSNLSEEEALQLLHKISVSKIRNFNAYIMYMVKRSPSNSPQKKACVSSQNLSPTTTRLLNYPEDATTRSPIPGHPSTGTPRAQTISPQLVALGELEFRKAFLILSYIGDKRLEDVISAHEIRGLKDFSMLNFEAAVWNALGQLHISEEDRRKSVDWDTNKTHLYHCYVYPDGSYSFKGPYLNKTRTLLQRELGDDNVLVVKFGQEMTGKKNSGIDLNVAYDVYRKIAREGIIVGLRRYRFFVFKDGGKEEKRKSPTSSPVKCYFVCLESNAMADVNKNILIGKTVHEARCYFMHAHTVSSVANYMARFSLILSKTRKLEVNLSSTHIERIDDVPCQDQNGSEVYKNGKRLIHTDGTGFISEDLAMKCPKNLFKGEKIFKRNVEGILSADESRGKGLEIKRPASVNGEPPLLIQFRLFNNGCAVKGTLMVNKKLPPRTIQIRPSMIKVTTDSNLSQVQAVNSLEVVGTSNHPRKTYLSKNLIALLSYGGVPKDFFMEILLNALEDANGVYSSKRAALRVAINHGEIDDFSAAKMILSGIPLDEPYLQYRLSILTKEEKKSLRAGKLPVPECYYLMGTVDPTGTLESDEVCIILDNGHLSGKVLVYRNPGLHFGDIHVLKAKYVEELDSIIGNAKYAIFFSCKGPRSLADEIAGGDFDGDMYWVSKNPQLLEYFRESKPWTSPSTLNVPNKMPIEFSHEELEDELIKLFLMTRFQPSYTVSVAADSWLALMDRLLTLRDDSTDERESVKVKILRLIDIYYDALDAPKKGGKKIEVPNELKAEMFPHYMERDEYQSYTSTSILGQIYETVKSYEVEDISMKEVRKLPCFDVEVPEACLKAWMEHYDSYRRDMTAALKVSEEEKNESAEEVIRKYKQMLYGAAEFEESTRKIEEIFEDALAIYHITYDFAARKEEVIRKYKQMLYGAAEFEESTRKIEEIFEDALAIYHITYDFAARKEEVKKCMFAWKVAGSALCKLYAVEQGEKSIACLPSVLKEVFR